MKLQRFRAQKVAVKNALRLGLLIFILNCILTFIYLDYALHNTLSYLTAPLIMFFAGLTGFQRMKQKNHIPYAIQSSILTVSLSLVIGFGTLYILTSSFIDIVRNNPVTLTNFHASGQGDLDGFIYRSIIDAITASVPVSIILGIISGTIGALLSKRFR